MRDKLLDLIVELSKSTKQVIAKDYIIQELYVILKEDEENGTTNTK
ncbi:TPA: hypothetical protein ACGW22_005681 [Bacillus paranthracis]|uniref:Uncharacterized protein n=3 Tax=root TaxID=1 RepID=A0A7D8D2H9_9BACI|nr:putative gene regulator [Bacillus phage Sato]AFX65202.1 putative gene regulator [Bacillus phage Sato]AFX65206.1 putative gene regulator [Bacillus phage Emet]QWE49629.1 putative gene regulator [Bacillus phage Sato]SMD61444.1 hypothetical protein BACERE00174_00349 [Bacillus paranthracis]